MTVPIWREVPFPALARRRRNNWLHVSLGFPHWSIGFTVRTCTKTYNGPGRRRRPLGRVFSWPYHVYGTARRGSEPQAPFATSVTRLLKGRRDVDVSSERQVVPPRELLLLIVKSGEAVNVFRRAIWSRPLADLVHC